MRRRQRNTSGNRSLVPGDNACGNRRLVPGDNACEHCGAKGGNQKHLSKCRSLEPFLFTTALIRRDVRNNPRSWRPAGFIPDLDAKSSAEKAFINRKNQGETAQSYHLALGHILKGFEEMQRSGMTTWMQVGNHRKLFRLRPVVAFIIGDGKSADMLALRLPSHHETDTNDPERYEKDMMGDRPGGRRCSLSQKMRIEHVS
jgi:hypothetical protein